MYLALLAVASVLISTPAVLILRIEFPLTIVILDMARTHSCRIARQSP
jgi:hypothetical protein